MLCVDVDEVVCSVSFELTRRNGEKREEKEKKKTRDAPTDNHQRERVTNRNADSTQRQTIPLPTKSKQHTLIMLGSSVHSTSPTSARQPELP